MDLRHISIKRFRSIENSELADCGAFNVLIGKNNSGKSNALSAVLAFFRCIGNGEALVLTPPIGQEIDFHNGETDAPIQIRLTFLLSEAEMQDLKRGIINEAPQMSNAAEAIDSSPWLHVTVNVAPPPDHFSYVDKITLSEVVLSPEDQANSESLIFSIGKEASLELYERSSRSKEQNSTAEVLSSIDRRRLRDALEYARERGRRPPVDLVFGALRNQRSSAPFREVEAILDTASSFQEADNELKSLAEKLREDALSASRQPLTKRVRTFVGDEDSVPNYVQTLLTKIAEMQVLYLRERRNPIGQEEATRLLDLKVERGGTDVLRSIQETVSSLMGVQIDAFRGSAAAESDDQRAELDVDSFLVQVNGSGIREALRLVLDYEFAKPKILLVEEPEMHLHPALETSMMRYLKRISSNCQVFVTTHSTNFLDTADLRNVYLVSKDGSTQIRLVNIEQAESQIPRELGIRLSSLFMFDRLVFVEGSSDEDILREWASTMGVNFSQANVGFIKMHGVGNLRHFAAEETLAFLTKRQVQMWFVMDRDERQDDDIKRIKSRLGENAVAKFLTRREIENYLVLARPVTELIKEKLQSSTKQDLSSLTETDVRESLDKSAENLKDVAISKRVAAHLCKPIYPSRERLLDQDDQNTIADRAVKELESMSTQLSGLKSEAQKVCKEQSEALDEAWPNDKFSIVPGDELLDATFKQYGLRFRKERDSLRLAALMYESEIPQEIKELIREIAE